MGQRTQWHHRVRESWAREHLDFWWFDFPEYVRGDVVSTLREVLDLNGVTSYALYELYGGFDVMLRAWFPGPRRAFEDALRERLGYVATAWFSVTRTIQHWPWVIDGRSEMRELSSEELARPLPGPEVAEVNAGTVSIEQFAQLERRGLLTSAPHSQGIKFVTLISAHRATTTSRAKQLFEARLSALVESASSITEKSLYAGDGSYSYVLMGRVPYGDFHCIEREITDPINSTVDVAMSGARTRTYVIALEDFLDFRDELHLTEEVPEQQTVAELLERDESQTLEVKGSAFADLSRLYLGDGQLQLKDSVADEGVLKALCGMLNSVGGSLVIGALEHKRFAGVQALSDAPRIGDYVCVGLGPDFGKTGWDEWLQRLQRAIANRIRPNALDPQFLRIERQGVGPEAHGAMCVITIQPPARRGEERRRAFWLYPSADSRPTFYVRQGNGTMGLDGPELDDYLGR